jgi:hypothetical protein
VLLVAAVDTETIVDRIDRLVREAIEDGRYRSATHFWSAEGCGLSRSFLPRLRDRLTAPSPDGRAPSLTFESATKIATALGLPVVAITGDLDPPSPADPYPNRSWAVDAARNLQIPEKAIQVVMGEDHGSDLPRIAWFMRIYGESLRLLPTASGSR